MRAASSRIVRSLDPYPIRRASDMAHVGEMFQIGLRPIGSARVEEVDVAHAHGAHLITACELHDAGRDSVLARIPDDGRYYLTDLDGMDPSIAPAVAAPCLGVTFGQAISWSTGWFARAA